MRRLRALPGGPWETTDYGTDRRTHAPLVTGPRAADTTRVRSDELAAGSGSSKREPPRRPLHPGHTASPHSAATPARAGYAAGPALRGGGVYAPGAARPLSGAPGVRRASRRQRGTGTFRLSLASPERVYERSVPAVADDDAAPAGE